MIIVVLFTLFGIHGAGLGLMLNLFGLYALDRRLARREMARLDSYPGRYIHGPDDPYGPAPAHRPLRDRLRARAGRREAVGR